MRQYFYQFKIMVRISLLNIQKRKKEKNDIKPSPVEHYPKHYIYS